MITVEEYHIAFKEAFNQISSFQGLELLDDEIDRYLTRGEVALITQLYNRYTQNQQFSRELASLEVINYKTDVYYPVNTEVIWFEKSGFNFGYIVPPVDYMYPLNIKLAYKTGKTCDTGYVESSSSVTEYISVVPFNSELIGSHTDLDFIVTLGSTELLNLSSYNLPSIEEENDKFYFIQTALELLNSRNRVDLTGDSTIVDPANLFRTNNVFAYWEKYREFYYPNSFIFVTSTNPNTDFIEIKIDSSSATSYSVTDTDLTYYVIAEEKSRNSFYAQTYQKKDSTGGSVSDVSITREIDKTKAIDLLDNPLDKPTRKRPHSIHSDQYIWIHTPSRTLAQTAYLDYIKYPRIISKRLQWHSQLNRLLMQDAVNYAVQFAMAEVGDQKIQIKTQIDKLDT